MARIVVIGGGFGGLTTALLLGRDGHQVTVLERDPDEPGEPAAAFDRWARRGVPQFRLPHVFIPRSARSSTTSCRTSTTPSPPPAPTARTAWPSCRTR